MYGLRFLIITSGNDKWILGGSLIVALVIDVAFASHDFHSWHFERILLVDDHRDDDGSLIAFHLKVVKLEIHIDSNVIACFFHFLVEKAHFPTYQLLCFGRHTEQNDCCCEA